VNHAFALAILAACGRVGFELDEPPVAGEHMDPAAPDAASPAVTHLRVHAVLVSDDDGGRPVAITTDQIATWVDRTSTIFGDAGLAFDFDPAADVSSAQSTLLNGMMGNGDAMWTAEQAAGNAIAAAHPGEVVVIFRHGPSPGPTGVAFSWSDIDFVAGPGFLDTSVCGHQNRNLLGLVFGHYFGLFHTFVARYTTVLDAETAFVGANNVLTVFDGDALADTPPDPDIDSEICTQSTEVTLAGVTFAIPRDNAMSFLDAPTKHLTAQQAARVRELVSRRFGR
jgi:hypothetical protein